MRAPRDSSFQERVPSTRRLFRSRLERFVAGLCLACNLAQLCTSPYDFRPGSSFNTCQREIFISYPCQTHGTPMMGSYGEYYPPIGIGPSCCGAAGSSTSLLDASCRLAYRSVSSAGVVFFCAACTCTCTVSTQCRSHAMWVSGATDLKMLALSCVDKFDGWLEGAANAIPHTRMGCKSCGVDVSCVARTASHGTRFQSEVW